MSRRFISAAAEEKHTHKEFPCVFLFFQSRCSETFGLDYGKLISKVLMSEYMYVFLLTY